jgi:molybdenum cofactor cytidylyltransferase
MCRPTRSSAVSRLISTAVVDAPPAKVWEVFADFGGVERFNPSGQPGLESSVRPAWESPTPKRYQWPRSICRQAARAGAPVRPPGGRPTLAGWVSVPVGEVVGVVLAAGRGDRMGRRKQLLAYRGGTLLGRAVAEAEASSLDRVVVVLGASADEVEASLALERAIVVRNPDFTRGNLSSLRTGVEAAGAHEAVVHLVGDMPGVDAGLIDEVVEAWRRNPRPLAVTRYRDRIAHPFVLGAATTANLGDLEEPKAIWRLIEASPDVLTIQVDRDGPVDVDTPGDYERLLGEA